MSYPQSEAYKEAIKRLTRTTFIEGTITTTKGVVIDIKNDDISSGSLYITNQCVNDDSSLKFGAVYSAECGISITTAVDRYSLYDAKVKLSYFIKLDDGTYEECKLGSFYVSEPVRKGQKVVMKAYDSMLFFDTPIQDEITGTPFEVLSFICDVVGVGFSQTQEEIEAFTNGSILLTVSPTYVKTYREAISYISCLLCGFCYIDRNSELKIGTYKKSVSNVIEAKARTTTSVSDFYSYFKGVTAQFEYEGAFENYLKVDELSDGLLCNVGKIPVVLNSPREFYQSVVDKMFEEISTINHTPSTIVFNGDPSIELGDMISIVQRNGEVVNSLVTFYKWTYRGSEQIKCAGGNPKLPSTKEDTGDDILFLQSEIESKSIAVHTYTNASRHSFSSKETQIISINFASVTDTKAIFNAMAEFELSNDAEVIFRYYFDGVHQEADDVIVYCNKGKNVTTLINSISMLSDSRATLKVTAQVRYVESDKRKTDAKIISYENFINAAKQKILDISYILNNTEEESIEFDGEITYIEGEIDTTIPTCVFDKDSVRAVLFGQGLAGTSAWDGTINVSENLAPIKIIWDEFKVSNMHEIVSANAQAPRKIDATDEMKLTFAGGIEYKQAPMNDILSTETIVIPVSSVQDTMKSVKFNVMFSISNQAYVEFDASNQYVVSDNGVLKLKDTYVYEGCEAEIDEGKCLAVQIETVDKQVIEEIIIEGLEVE